MDAQFPVLDETFQDSRAMECIMFCISSFSVVKHANGSCWYPAICTVEDGKDTVRRVNDGCRSEKPTLWEIVDAPDSVAGR